MKNLHRRTFLAGGTGLLALGAHLTPSSGDLGAYAQVISQSPQSTSIEIPRAAVPERIAATEDNILGPYHRDSAPFRAKITPPLEPGDPLIVQGRVWGLDSRRPLVNAVLDIWQANAAGRYDNDDRSNQPADNVFVNRARLITNETGYYEYETIKPGRYAIGPDRWRPAHIHYLVTAHGYQQLITQMYFDGDPMNDNDDFIKPSLIVAPESVRTENGVFQLGTFDIVLAPA